jgi:hypothetical protein
MAFTPLAVKDGNGAAQSTGAFQDAASVSYPNVSLDSNRAYYRASAASTAIITTAGKTLMTVTGSATKTVRITRIGLYFSAATAAEAVVQLQRVSAIGTGGTGVAPTVAKLDTNSAAATAVVTHFTTGAQSTGVAVGGPITTISINEAVTTTAPTFFGQPVTLIWPELGVPGQSIVLRGIADILELQNPVAVGTTPKLSYFVEWIEDNS